MNHLISSSLSVDTASQYSKVWSDFRNFCTISLNEQFVVNAENIALYIAHLDLRKLQPSTIQSHLSAISFIARLNNIPDPTMSFSIEKMMKSLHKNSPSKDTRLPINQALLNKLLINLNNHCDSAYECAMYRAIFSVAYYALLRAGECTFSKHVLLLSNIRRFMSGGRCEAIEISFSSFKNSSSKKSNTPVLKIQRRGGEACPVSIIDHYLSIRTGIEGPLFISAAGNPVLPTHFRIKLKACVSFLSLDKDRFNVHSFRIGRATDMLCEGYSEEQIRAAGRWQSRAFLKYLRPGSIIM